MIRAAYYCAVVMVMGSAHRGAHAQAGAVFVGRPGQVIELIDLNGDGDFLDFAESRVFADGLPTDLNRITANGGSLFVGASTSAEIFVVRDLNSDGDALDFGEVILYGQLPPQVKAPQLAGLGSAPDGRLFATDATTGELYAFVDPNGDGDAMDFAETLLVANGLSAPTAVTIRPDGVVLLAQNDVNIPVRVLQDRNADGDFLDFAENLSYVETGPAVDDLFTATDTLAFAIRTATGEVAALRDGNGDDDALDVGEVVLYAAGMDSPLVVTSAGIGAGSLFVAAGDVAGTVYLVRDVNGDGDALDFAEVIPVATGLTQPTGIVMVLAATLGCLKGDVNIDTLVDFNDVAPFVQILVCASVPADPCPADVNGDGAINGEDVQAFVDALFGTAFLKRTPRDAPYRFRAAPPPFSRDPTGSARRTPATVRAR